jgi:hypothetical protein
MTADVRQQQPVGHERVAGLAQAAIALGVPVIPCDAEKRPLTRHGLYDASRDRVTIGRGFARPAARMIGVPTGRVSGLVVVGVDTKDGKRGMEWLERHADAIPNTRTHRTMSGGLHLVFRQPEGVEIASSQSRIAPGVDVRGQGGYIIAPPSPGYSVVVDAPMADMPEWLIEACRKKASPPAEPVPTPRRPWLDARDAGARRLVALMEFVADAREGQRNSRLFWAACRAAEAAMAGAMPAGVAFMALEQAAVAIGLPAAEAQRTIQSARRTAYGSAAA